METSPKLTHQFEAVIQPESVKGNIEKAGLYREEYVNAVERFTLERANEIDPQLCGEEAKRTGLESMNANYMLLEDIKGSEVADDAVESVCTIAIPVAILSEDIDSVVRVVEKLGNSHMGNETPLDIVIWANAKYSDNSKADREDDSAARYAELTEKLQQISDRQLRIKMALQLIPEEDFSMSKLRSNYMDAVALDSLNRGYGFNHPVMWIDADMTNIAAGTIVELANTVRDNEALFSHANLQYSIDWRSGVPIDQLDDAEKAVIFNEMQRRQLKALSVDGSMGEYPEESGLAFTVGVYLNAGGVDKTDPINESGRLTVKADYAMFGLGIHSQEIIPKSIPVDWYELKHVKNIKSSRMSTSARRHYEVAKQQGAGGLFDVDKSGYGDTLFTDMKQSNEIEKISKADIRELSEDNNRNWEENSPTGRLVKSQAENPNTTEQYVILQQKQVRNRKIANKLIERHFKD